MKGRKMHKKIDNPINEQNDKDPTHKYTDRRKGREKERENQTDRQTGIERSQIRI